MSRYIDADALKQKWLFRGKDGKPYRDEIDAMPTADVVKVVRCEKCTYGYIYPNNFNGYCRKRRDMVYANDFCSEGERIDE